MNALQKWLLHHPYPYEPELREVFEGLADGALIPVAPPYCKCGRALPVPAQAYSCACGRVWSTEVEVTRCPGIELERQTGGIEP